jgi:hypothetical protein
MYRTWAWRTQPWSSFQFRWVTTTGSAPNGVSTTAYSMHRCSPLSRSGSAKVCASCTGSRLSNALPKSS